MNLDEIKRLALETQCSTIRNWMLENFGDSERIIRKWDDHMFYIAWFYTPTTPSASETTVRKWMRRLAEAGVVEVRQWRKGGSICYRFSREICAKMAEEGVKYWQAVGYSQYEWRPMIKPQAKGD